MALPLPQLDNRTFDELVREGRRVLPRRAPDWTDHNVHDPGITIIELLSWLVEQDFYRLDRAPDAARRAFLRLVGIEPAPPQVASTVVELAIAAGASTAAVPRGTRVRGARGDVGPVFETTEDCVVAACRLVALAQGAPDREDDFIQSNERAGTSYAPLGEAPRIDDVLYLGFDAAPGDVGEVIALHVWTETHTTDGETRRTLMAEHADALQQARRCGPGALAAVPDWRSHYGVTVAWEYPSAAGTWQSLPQLRDETRALTLSGFVRFAVPGDWAPDPTSSSVTHLLRCRVVSGRYECPPRLERIGLFAVEARHAVLVAAQALGVSDGTAGQRFDLTRSPVVAGSTQLEITHHDGSTETWREVPDWDRVGPHDRAFVLEPERGRACFGNGRIGRIPRADAMLSVRYRVGGGTTGNVPAGHLVRTATAEVVVHQPYAADGGAQTESLTAAQARAIEWLERRFRAVNLDDFEALALETPGVPVARARALAGYFPTLPCVTAAGCVTVVVVPRCPSPRPEPTAEFLEAVRRWLEPRVALTTELHVIGPCFQSVAVHARLHPDGSVPSDALLEAASVELSRYFDPFVGGPDGTGWPIGRDVHRAEVLARLGSVDGVSYVDGFGLRAEDDEHPRCGNLMICPDCLAASGSHHLEVVDETSSCASFEWNRSRGRR